MEVGQVKAEIMAGVDGFKTKIKDAKETLNTAIDAMKAKSNEMNVALENMDKKLELWAKQNKVAADSSKYHAKELENNKVKMKELSKQIEVTEKALSETEKQFGKNSTEYKKQENELLNLKIKYQDLIKETKKLEQSTSVWGRISHNMEKAGDKLKDIGGKMSSFGKEMTMKVTAPIVAVGTAATKMGMDFQKGMTKVNTIAQVGKKDLEALSKSTLKLSDDTGVVAKDLAEMEYNALSASVSVKDLTGVVKQSAELSKGGFADANDSLKLLTSTYNVYRGEFEKGNINQVKASEMIADKMMTIQNLGVTTVGELSTQIGNVTSIAKNANMTLDDLGASMIVLTKNGLGTSQSVTGLKAALSNIIKPSEQASKMAESLGLDFSTTAIKTKGFGGFLKDLREKLKSTSPALVEAADKVSKYQHMIDGASKSQKANKEQMRQWKGQLKDAKEQLKVLTKSGGETTGALAQLFGSVEGLGSVLTLTSEYGMKDFQDGLEASKNSLGSTKKAADMMAETTSEKFVKALNKLKNRGIKLGLKLMPLAEKGIKYIEEFTDWLSKLNPKTQEFAIKAAIAAAAFGPFVGGMGKAISGIGSMLRLGGDVVKFFGLFKSTKTATIAVEGLEVATGATTKGLGLMTTSGGVATKAIGLLGKVCSPVGLAIAGVSAAVYTVKKYNDAMGESCLKSSEDMGFMEKSLLKATGQVVYSKDELDKYNLKHKEFQNVSKETNKTLKETTQNVGELKLKLSSNANMSGMIDKKDSDELIQKIEKIFEDAKKAVETKSSEARAKIEEALKAEDGILDKREQEMIKKQDEMNETRLKKLDELHKRIKEKEQKLSKVDGEEKTKLVESLKKDLDEVAKIKMEATVKSNEELKNVKQQFNKEIANLDLEGSMKVFSQQRDVTKKEIEATRKKYDEQIATIKEYSKNAEGEDRKYWDNKISSLELQKNETIDKEREKLLGILGVVKEKFPEVTRLYDIETGKQLSRSEKAKQEELENYSKKMTGLYGITQSGWYKIRNEQDGKLHEIYVDVDNVTGGIQGIWDTTVQGVYGNPIKAREQIADELRNGVVFREIGNNYNTVKDDIYNNRLNVAYPSIPNNLFASIRTQWANTINKVGWGSYHGGMSVPSNYQGRDYATGTDSATTGLHQIAEEGFEIVFDRQYRWFNGGETVLNHSKSKEFLAGLANKVNVMKNMMAGIENVNWYSEGAIFTRPTVLNNIGVGDANNGHGSAPEAVMPIDKLEDYLYNAFVKAIKDTGVGNINMDGRKFIERLSPHMAMATKGRR